jgi:hypothetical protein
VGQRGRVVTFMLGLRARRHDCRHEGRGHTHPRAHTHYPLHTEYTRTQRDRETEREREASALAHRHTVCTYGGDFDGAEADDGCARPHVVHGQPVRPRRRFGTKALQGKQNE